MFQLSNKSLRKVYRNIISNGNGYLAIWKFSICEKFHHLENCRKIYLTSFQQKIKRMV